MSSPAKKTPAKAAGGDVLSRLTDPSKYTGAHKERFAADGTGRGLAGRRDVTPITGSTNNHSDPSPSAAVPVPKRVGATGGGGSGSSGSSGGSPGTAGSPRKGTSAPKTDAVLSRLTDPSRYTGAHKARFDADGVGKGIAGRVELVDYDGSTSSPSRDHAIHSTPVAASSPRTTKPKMAAGTTGLMTPPSIIVFRNGDKHHAGVKVTLHQKKYTTWENALLNFTGIVKPTTGAVRKVYNSSLKPIKSLDEFVDGGTYLCTGPERPDPPLAFPAQ